MDECNCPGPTMTCTTCPVHGDEEVADLPMWVVYDHPTDLCLWLGNEVVADLHARVGWARGIPCSRLTFSKFTDC
jgi:hypothetical protein